MTTTRYTIKALENNKFSLKRKSTVSTKKAAEANSDEVDGICNLLQKKKIMAPEQFIDLIKKDPVAAKLYYDIFNEMSANELLKNTTFTMLVNAKVNLGDAADYIIHFGLKDKLTEYHYIFILAQLKLAEQHSARREAFHVSLDAALTTAQQASTTDHQAEKKRRITL
jgi:hypothetical protein